jgi:hypothetical protein
MDINQELARIFANAGTVAGQSAISKLTNTEVKWVLDYPQLVEKLHAEHMAYIEDELRLIISSLEAARVTVQEVYKALNRHDIPIDQMMICAEDCLTESIDEAYKKLKGRRPAGE